jgi:hypothetical protein
VPRTDCVGGMGVHGKDLHPGSIQKRGFVRRLEIQARQSRLIDRYVMVCDGLTMGFPSLGEISNPYRPLSECANQSRHQIISRCSIKLF